MNYIIPKTRRQAKEIYDEYMRFFNAGFDSIPTKYYMFVGALTGCSDSEFSLHTTAFGGPVRCEVCLGFPDSINSLSCSGKCKDRLKEIFDKCWDE